MILVDTSVWIDYFRNTPTPAAERLDAIKGVERVGIGDLILLELLQGCRDDRQAASVLEGLNNVLQVTMGGRGIAIAAAQNFRHLRALGITVRKTIDTLIATFCIETGHSLLYSDRDFDPFVEHLGLEPALDNRPF